MGLSAGQCGGAAAASDGPVVPGRKRDLPHPWLLALGPRRSGSQQWL